MCTGMKVFSAKRDGQKLVSILSHTLLYLHCVISIVRLEQTYIYTRTADCPPEDLYDMLEAFG